MSTPADGPSVEALLRRADAAAAGNVVLDVLDDLTRLALAVADPRVEQRLVELRHGAFAELDRSPGRPSWPPELADPFPGEEGVPEVDAGTPLSGDLVGGAVVRHGCLLVRELLGPDLVARFVEQIDRSFAAREDCADDPSASSPWFVPFSPGRQKAEGFGRDGFVRAVDVPHALCELVDVFTRTGVRRAATEYFRERPAMIANKWVLRRSPSGKIGTDYHQDGAFLGEGIRTLDCWIALSRCGPGTGRPGLDLVPRRFDAILDGGEAAAFPWSLTEETVRDAAAGAPVVGPVFEAGDALFFDERLPHRTSVGLDLTTRYAIESWFVAPSSYPAKHVPVVL